MSRLLMLLALMISAAALANEAPQEIDLGDTTYYCSFYSSKHDRQFSCSSRVNHQDELLLCAVKYCERVSLTDGERKSCGKQARNDHTCGWLYRG